jgi:hypothetical protein
MDLWSPANAGRGCRGTHPATVADEAAASMTRYASCQVADEAATGSSPFPGALPGLTSGPQQRLAADALTKLLTRYSNPSCQVADEAAGDFSPFPGPYPDRYQHILPSRSRRQNI